MGVEQENFIYTMTDMMTEPNRELELKGQFCGDGDVVSVEYDYESLKLRFYFRYYMYTIVPRGNRSGALHGVMADGIEVVVRLMEERLL
ncbi:hypothetical protein ACLOJK_021414 [Asimina triloba]